MIGIIIPAYQAEQAVADVVRSCLSHDCIAEVLVVDDGSSDGTASNAARAGATVLSHSANRGKGAALVTGFAEASGRGWDAAITIDADGQHDPCHLPGFVDSYLSGNADLIIGARRRTGRMPLSRRLSNAMSSAVVSRLANARITDSQSGYRLIARPVWETVALTRLRYDMESEMLVKAGWAGFRIGEIPIDTVYGDETSHFHPIRDTWRLARVFISLWREMESR